MTEFTPAQLKKIEKLINDAVKAATSPLLTKIASLDKELKDLKQNESVIKTPEMSAKIWASFNDKKRTPEQCDFLNVIVNEQKERQSNERKAIIFGIPKSTKEDIEEKKKDDKLELDGIFEKLNIDKSGLKNFLRLKSKNEQAGIPSPIIVELKTFEERNKLVFSSYKNKIPNIFINRDQTESERHEAKKLREEIKRLNSVIDTNSTFFYGIRKNKIFKIDKESKKIIGRPESSSS